MPKYIDTMDAITELKKDFDGEECLKAIRAIQRANAADVQAVNHGKWISIQKDFNQCSLCNEAFMRPKYDYCPMCGARMDL